MDERDGGPSERGQTASFDRKSGAAHGSGANAGGAGTPGEDYDAEYGPGGSGHPLPASEEARHGEIPEHLEAEKGRGDDAPRANQPGPEPVTPDGEAYRYDDLGRGPDSKGQGE